MATYGRIYFQQGNEPERYITLKHCPSEQGLLYFTNILSGYTKIRVTRCEFVSVTWCEDEELPGDFQDADLRAIIKFRDHEDKKLFAIPLPAPAVWMFNSIDGDGAYRLKDTIGKEITAAYAVMAQQPFTYEHGWLIGNTR